MNQVLTISFKVITTGWTWVKCERAEGQKILSQLGYGNNENECYPSSKRVVPLGLRIDQCSATLTTMYNCLRYLFPKRIPRAYIP
jgi:hypothetical protein